MKKILLNISLAISTLGFTQTTVVDIIVGSENHTTLAAAVGAAGLVETLNAGGPFSVFAPTDDAFDLLPEGTVESLIADTTGALAALLTHHVSGGSTLSTDLYDGMMITTVAGTELMVSSDSNGVYIDGAMVTVADLTADNGVVHVINAVLLPDAEVESNTVVDIIVGSSDHTILAAAAVAAGLVETLSGDGSFTVFAPTDEAFALLPEGLVASLLEDPTGQLTTILMHHVYGGTALSTDLTDGMMVTTLAETELEVTIDSTGVYIGGAMVVTANLTADNGVVHVIDAVLVPVEDTTTVVDIIVNSPDHTTLEAAVGAAGLVETLSGDGPFTVFAPTDAAFALLPEGLVATLLEDPSGQLTTILTHHVYAGSALSTDLYDGMMVPTIAGGELEVMIDSTGVYIDNAMVTVANIETSNGVVHVIDAVLIPEEGLSTDESLAIEKQTYLYSIDILGKRINKATFNTIVFDVYSSGSVVKRFSLR